MKHIVKHPEKLNIDTITTSDDESMVTSEILISRGDLNFENVATKDENIQNLDNVVEKHDNVDNKNEPVNEKVSNDLENDKTEAYLDNDEQIEVYSNSDKGQKNEEDTNIEENEIEENNVEEIKTVEQPTEKKLDKKYLETLKVNDLKELAKKNKINLMNGKKIKNKTDLINDLIKL
jgi:hypothetical protein